MAAVTLDVARRQTGGTPVARRLRRTGQVPGVLYGHGLETVSLAVPRPPLLHAIERGARMLTLKLDGSDEQVLIREVQYDALGAEVIHVDFARVARDETISIEVPIELHGTPKGVLAGGVIVQPLHRLPIQCLAGSIPDAIRVEVAALDKGQGIHVRDLALPEGVTASVPADTVVVMVQEPKKEAEAAPPPEAAVTAEPEVIRAKPGEGEEEEKAEEKPAKPTKPEKPEKK